MQSIQGFSLTTLRDSFLGTESNSVPRGTIELNLKDKEEVDEYIKTLNKRADKLNLVQEHTGRFCRSYMFDLDEIDIDLIQMVDDLYCDRLDHINSVIDLLTCLYDDDYSDKRVQYMKALKYIFNM